MKFSPITFAASLAFATSAFAMNPARLSLQDITGINPPRLTDITGINPPRLSLQDITGINPPRLQ
jgi:hypothetical protein